MTIIAGFLRSPEGRAAQDRVIEEARLRDVELVVNGQGVLLDAPCPVLAVKPASD